MRPFPDGVEEASSSRKRLRFDLKLFSRRIPDPTNGRSMTLHREWRPENGPRSDRLSPEARS